MTVLASPMKVDSATKSPTELVIEVTYLRRTKELEVKSPRGCGDPGATVTWLFFQLPSRQHPRISFPESDNRELGPFLEIRSAPSKIQGLSSPSAAGSYLYQITLEPAADGVEPIDDLVVPDRYLCFGDDEPPPHRNPGG